MIWALVLCSELAGKLPPSTGSTVTDGRGDHHTCGPTGGLTGGPTGLRRWPALPGGATPGRPRGTMLSAHRGERVGSGRRAAASEDGPALR